MAITLDALAPLKASLEAAGVPYTMSFSGRQALFCRDEYGNGWEFGPPTTYENATRLFPPYLRADDPATASPILRWGGIPHVGILVSDNEKARDFYCGVLGMVDENDLRPTKLPFPGLFLRCGEQQVHILELPNPDPDAAADRPGAGKDRCTAYTVKDLGGSRRPRRRRHRPRGVDARRRREGALVPRPRRHRADLRRGQGDPADHGGEDRDDGAVDAALVSISRRASQDAARHVTASMTAIDTFWFASNKTCACRRRLRVDQYCSVAVHVEPLRAPVIADLRGAAVPREGPEFGQGTAPLATASSVYSWQRRVRGALYRAD